MSAKNVSSLPIRLLHAPQKEFPESNEFKFQRIFSWLRQDPRFQFEAISEAASLESFNHFWVKGIQNLSQGQISCLVWLAKDVNIHDFLLADRVMQLPRGRWEIKNQNGFPLIRVANDPSSSTEFMDGRKLPISFSIRSKQGFTPLTKVEDCEPLLIVTATRTPAKHFYTQTALGRSINVLRRLGLTVKIMANCENQSPLADVFNQSIKSEFAGHLVIFAHDDIELHDWHLGFHLSEALKHFDVIGVSGCKNSTNGQPGWAFPRKIGEWANKKNLLGCIGHDTLNSKQGLRKLSLLSRFGESIGKASLLDGVFIAARMDTLLVSQLRFDRNFAFHFYDLDFCRSATAKGMTLGVWPLAMTHQSGGNFSSPEWQEAYSRYLEKWGDLNPSRSI